MMAESSTPDARTIHDCSIEATRDRLGGAFAAEERRGLMLAGAARSAAEYE
jgi:hypothetical protein